MSVETNAKPSRPRRAWNWLKSLVMRHKIISALVLLYLLSKAITTPIVNPFASDVYTIRGRFPFDKGYELVFQQYVEGNAKWFQRWCGFPFSEEAICSSGSITLKPFRTDANHYEIKIYRDRYFSGPADWKHAITHAEFKSAPAIDVNRLPRRWYINDESSVCDDSEEFMKKYRGALFCTSQFRHKDFKHLSLPDGQPVQANERLINFWLERELTPLFEAQRPGAKP